MGKIILLIISLYFVNVTFSKESKKKIRFEIQNSSMKDKTMLHVRLVNNSNKNVFISLDTIKLKQDFYFFSNEECFNGIKIRENLRSSLKDQPIYITANTLSERNIYNLGKSISINNEKEILLLRSGQVVDFYYYFSLLRAKSNESKEYNVEHVRENGGKVFFNLSYLMTEEWGNYYIDKELIKDLYSKGYSPYYQEINSNTIELVY